MVNKNKLKGEIYAHGLTVETTAERMGITKQALYKILNGDTAFRLDHINRIAAVLDLTPDKIIEIFFATDVPEKGLKEA